MLPFGSGLEEDGVVDLDELDFDADCDANCFWLFRVGDDMPCDIVVDFVIV